MSDIKATETPAPREKLEGGQILFPIVFLVSA